MIDKFDVRELIEEIFVKEALMIGGLVAAHRVPDDLVKNLMSCLDDVYTKALVHLAELGGRTESERERPDLTPHPAIEEFLNKLGRDTR